jgi:amino acid transporter
LHFTLFAAAIVIIGDLVSLVFRFLNGDLTIQFVLKVLTVFLIAASVFTYYLWNIRKNIPATKDPRMRWFIRTVVAIAGFFIVFSFFAVGSPFSQRLTRFDERRVSNLQVIQSEIIYYWQAKEVLPQSLDQLRDSIRGFIPPIDPETGGSYQYRIMGPLEFELCADFKTSNKQDTEAGKAPVPAIPRGHNYPYPFPEDNWLHDAVRTCFTRTIDPDLFPPLGKTR